MPVKTYVSFVLVTIWLLGLSSCSSDDASYGLTPGSSVGAGDVVGENAENGTQENVDRDPRQSNTTSPKPKVAELKPWYGQRMMRLMSPSYLDKQATVRTYFATDRLLVIQPDTTPKFSGADSFVSYGYCDVTMPPGHEYGKLESPSVLRLEFNYDKEKHVKISEIAVQTKERYFSNLASKIHERSMGSNVLVFIHGYNVSFDDAARRTAQIAYDMEFDGIPVFFSWPSQAEVSKYTVDRQNIERSTPHIKNFLDDIFARTGADNIYLIAHSMGNQGMGRALAQLLTDKPQYKSKLKEVILTAPDIDVTVFKDQIAPALVEAGANITLYASSLDKALMMSRKINGKYRLGDTIGGVTVIPGVETIDATLANTDFLGHSYFGTSSSVVLDMAFLLRYHTKAKERLRMRPMSNNDGEYWQFHP